MINDERLSGLITDPDIAQRIISGQEIAAKRSKIISFDPDSCTMQCIGSGGVYDVTLDSCTCVDFSIFHGARRCKHIFALSILCGAEYDLPALDPAAAKAFDFDGEVEHLRQLWVAGIIDLDAYRRCASALAKSKRTAEKIKLPKAKKRP